MDDINGQIEQLRQNRGRSAVPLYIEEETDENDAEEKSEKPERVEGVSGAFAFQLILVLIIVIAYVLLATFATPVSSQILALIKDKEQNDFSFRDSVYDSVGSFLTYINQQNQDENEQLPSSDISADTDTDVDAEALPPESQPPQLVMPDTVAEVGAGVGAAGGEFTPVINNEIPENATLSAVKMSGKMIFPLKAGHSLTSAFGFRDHPGTGSAEFHTAADIAAKKDSEIYAAADGTVMKSGVGQSLGNYVLIDHGNELFTIYGHCGKLYAKEGEKVSAGERIAVVGSTGDSTGYHLHFGIKKSGLYFDPGYIFDELKG